MPATPARIGFIQQDFRKVTVNSPDVETRFGKLARKSEDPVPTFFDSVTDAQTVATERQSLLSFERRRVTYATKDVERVLEIDYTGRIPVVMVEDNERGIHRKALVSEIAIDFATQRASITVWG